MASSKTVQEQDVKKVNEWLLEYQEYQDTHVPHVVYGQILKYSSFGFCPEDHLRWVHSWRLNVTLQKSAA